MADISTSRTPTGLSSFGLFSKPTSLFNPLDAIKIARGLVSDLVGGGENVQSPLNVELINALKKEIPNFEKLLGTLLNLLVANVMKAPHVICEIAKQFVEVLPRILEVIDNFSKNYENHSDTKVRNSVISEKTNADGKIVGLAPRVGGCFNEILNSFSTLASTRIPELKNVVHGNESQPLIMQS